MNYYKGLFYVHCYNVGFFGGWRCGDIFIDGHYSFVTDLNQFVVWKFGTYESLTTIKKVREFPKLTEIEIGYCNDVLLEGIRKAMSNSLHPNLTFIEEPLWDTVYGQDRVKMKRMWGHLVKYPFKKHNCSLNIHQGDTVKNKETGKIIKVSYMYDLRALNKDDLWELTDRYSYFPEINIPENLK